MKTDVVPSPAKKEKLPVKKENKKLNKKQLESNGLPSSKVQALANDVEAALKNIKGKYRSKLLFGSGTMEGNWYDQVRYMQ